MVILFYDLQTKFSAELKDNAKIKLDFEHLCIVEIKEMSHKCAEIDTLLSKTICNVRGKALKTKMKKLKELRKSQLSFDLDSRAKQASII